MALGPGTVMLEAYCWCVCVCLCACATEYLSTKEYSVVLSLVNVDLGMWYISYCFANVWVPQETYWVFWYIYDTGTIYVQS